MNKCIFCEVIARETPGYFVLETKSVISFLDIFGSAPGHSLVVHRRHGNNIQDYSKAELGELMEAVKTVSGKMEKALKTDSITIGINHKEEKGVPHLHIHLIPRFKNDGGKFIQSVVSTPNEENLGVIAEKIRNS